MLETYHNTWQKYEAWTLIQSLFAFSDGFRIDTPDGNTERCEGRTLRRNINVIGAVIDLGIGLESRAKSDSVTKLIAVL